jgi:hypothetical protein
MGLTVDTPALGLRLEPPPHTKTRTARGGFLVGRGVPHSICYTVTRQRQEFRRPLLGYILSQFTHRFTS